MTHAGQRGVGLGVDASTSAPKVMSSLYLSVIPGLSCFYKLFSGIYSNSG